MHNSLLAWQSDRRRRVRSCFANLPLGRSYFLGGSIPVKQEAKSRDKDNKNEEDKQKESKDEHNKPAEKDKGRGLGKLLKEEQDEDKPERPPAARIVAYSDSEGEDEPFRLTRRRQKKADEEQTDTEEKKEEEPSSSAAKEQTVQVASNRRSVFRAARLSARQGASRLQQECTWGLLLQVVLLWLFRRWKRRPAERFELLTLAISLPDALCSILGQRCPSTRLPTRLQRAVQFAESWAKPAALLRLEGLAHKAIPKKKRRRMLTTISQSVRVFKEAELDALSPSSSSRPLPRAQPRLAVEAAQLYHVELAEMQRILAAQGVKLPAERFDETNAELLRFAASAGLLQAASPEEKAHAIQEGAQRVLKTLDWLKRHRCMPPAQLKEWQHMVRWQGSDTQGWPILVIKIAKACAECQGAAAEAVAEAIISQMQRAMTEVFSNQHGPDKVVVVMDASGANSLQAARNVTLFKHVAVTLNRHFPHRLHQLFLVDLPSQLRWVLATLKPLLHPQTKEKIHTISISDPALPLPASALQAPRLESDAVESASDAEGEGAKARRVSIPELPVSGASPAGHGRRTSIPALPSAEEPRRRRVRILELPVREHEPKTPPNARGGSYAERGDNSSILRPALKRSMSVGLIGIKNTAEQDEEAVELGIAAEQAEASMARGGG